MHEQAVRLLYTDVSPRKTETWRVEVLARGDSNRYLLQIPNPSWNRGTVLIDAEHSDSLRGWTIILAVPAGKPIDKS